MNANWLFLLFFPAFIALWCGVTFLVAALGGWRSLAATYAANAPSFRGRTWTMRNGYMRLGTRYSGILTIGADARGLYLDVFPLFRVGHAPMYIPWEDVEIREERAFLMPLMEFRFRRHPDVRLSTHRGVGEEVAREGNRPVARLAAA